jgi:hypothetical protein
MPSYLVSAKEAFVPTELYKPPFEAIGDMLRIKQQQYMEGFQKIKALDNSLFNKPVLGEAANEAKQKYMADISRQLKDLPTLDLSNPSNVASAMKAFEPMINDQALNANRAMTATAYDSIQTAESFELSDDPKKRAQYHPAAKQDIYDMMEEISEAGMDPRAYQKIAKRKFTPFFDIKQDIVDHFKNEKGMDLTYDEEQGNWIVRTTNGSRTLENYEVMAADVLNDPKYNQQFSVQSRVEMNRKIRETRSQVPGMSRDQARQQVISEMGTSAEQYYSNMSTELKAKSDSLRENLTAMGPVETDPTKPGYDPRRLEIAQMYGAQIAQIDSKYNNVVSKKPDLIKGIQINPEGYIAERIKDGYANSFAKARAANTSRELKTNDVAFKMDESKRGWAAINLNIQKEVNDQTNATAKIGGSGKVEYNPDGSVKMTAQQIKEKAVEPSLVGYELNTDSNKRQAHDIWNNYMVNINDKANNALLDVNSGLVSILSTVGSDITPEDIMNFSSAMRNDLDNPDYKFNAAEAKASNKITKAIKEKYGMNITGPGSLANALNHIVKDYGSRVASGEIQDDGGILVKMEAASDDYVRNKREWTALNDEYEKLVVKNVASNPKFKNILYDEDGTQRLITPDKMAEEFKNLKWVNPETNRVEKISKAMAVSLATDFLGGKDPLSTGVESHFGSSTSFPVMNINGQKVRVYLNQGESHILSNSNSTTGTINAYEAGLDGFKQRILNKYGKPVDLKANYESALGQVVPNLKYWKDKTGQMTPVSSMPFSSELKGEDAVRLVQELSIGNNIASAMITEADGTVRDLTPAERMALMTITKAGEADIEKAFGTPRYKPFTSGRGSVELTLSPSLSDDYLDDNNLKGLKGRPITFNLSRDAQGETIKKIGVDEKFYTYGDVLKGKTVESNSALKALGYSFTVVPDFNNERAQFATIYYNYLMPNKDNPSKPIVMKKASNPVRIKGDGAVDIDQLIAEARMNLVNQFKAVQQSLPKTSAGSNTAVDPTSFIR